MDYLPGDLVRDFEAEATSIVEDAGYGYHRRVRWILTHTIYYLTPQAANMVLARMFPFNQRLCELILQRKFYSEAAWASLQEYNMPVYEYLSTLYRSDWMLPKSVILLRFLAQSKLGMADLIFRNAKSVSVAPAGYLKPNSMHKALPYHAVEVVLVSAIAAENWKLVQYLYETHRIDTTLIDPLYGIELFPRPDPGEEFRWLGGRAVSPRLMRTVLEGLGYIEA